MRRLLPNISRTFGFLLFAAGFFFMAPHARAALLDIDNGTGGTTTNFGSGTGDGTGGALCQSFVPGASVLSGVDFKIGRSGSAGSNTDFEIRITSGGCYNLAGSVTRYAGYLSSATVNAWSTGSTSVVHYDLTAPINTTPGTTYYLNLVARNHTTNWLLLDISAASTYAGGNLRSVYSNFTNSTNIPTSDMFFRTYGAPPACIVNAASQAVTPSGAPTLYARGTCSGFYPSEAWLGAVRIDPVGSHETWSQGLGPFPNPYELETSDFPARPMTNGRWRVRMYGRENGVVVTSGYVDVTLTGNPYTFLSNTGNPYDYEFDPNDTVIGVGNDGYTFSASAAQIIASGGLRIDAAGCAHVPGEDATSTLCTGSSTWNALFDTFPLLSWPLGIFTAMTRAKDRVELAPTAYTVGLPSHGTWIPAVTLVDSASSGAGIGKYISNERQQFFRSILGFGVWVAFVVAMKRKADRLLSV